LTSDSNIAQHTPALGFRSVSYQWRLPDTNKGPEEHRVATQFNVPLCTSGSWVLTVTTRAAISQLNSPSNESRVQYPAHINNIESQHRSTHHLALRACGCWQLRFVLRRQTQPPTVLMGHGERVQVQAYIPFFINLFACEDIGEESHRRSWLLLLAYLCLPGSDTHKFT
jgi:hypothetical protein